MSGKKPAPPLMAEALQGHECAYGYALLGQECSHIEKFGQFTGSLRPPIFPIFLNINRLYLWHSNCMCKSLVVCHTVSQRDMQPRRRSHRRNRSETYLAIAGLVLAGVLVVLVLFSASHFGLPRSNITSVNDNAHRDLSDFFNPSGWEPESNGPRRLVYPYSVIPGGVRNAQELKEAISRDPVVAQHYAGFQRDRARIVQLPAAKAVYVSYRIGSGVFWTKRRIHLVKGEKVVTDGENYARTRCGNRISETPQAKTSPQEPSPKTLETPREDPSDREIISVLMNPAPVSGASNPIALGTAPVATTPTGGVFVPIIPIVPGSNNPPPKNGAPPILPPNGGLPVTPVPEPSTFLLMASGLAGYLGYRRAVRK